MTKKVFFVINFLDVFYFQGIPEGQLLSEEKEDDIEGKKIKSFDIDLRRTLISVQTSVHGFTPCTQYSNDNQKTVLRIIVKNCLAKHCKNESDHHGQLVSCLEHGVSSFSQDYSFTQIMNKFINLFRSVEDIDGCESVETTEKLLSSR